MILFYIVWLAWWSVVMIISVIEMCNSIKIKTKPVYIVLFGGIGWFAIITIVTILLWYWEVI